VSGYDLSAGEVADFQQYQNDMWRAIDNRGAVEPDTTTRAAMPAGPWAETARCTIPQMLGGDAEVTSAKDSANYADASGDWLVEGGLGAFIRELHSDVPVALNCPVQSINYAGAGVRVMTPLGELQAGYLVLTVSTGVLAAGTIRFDPPLPERRQAAVDMLPNGLLNKVGIAIDPAWQVATTGQIADYHIGGDAFCSLYFGVARPGLAVGFVAGRFAAELEQQGAGAATDFCLQGLRAIFGNDVTKYIRRTDETAWLGNPFTLGSYSYAKPFGTAARSTLAEPLADRVFFAGEATMTNSFSTVHGAYLSGLRAAGLISDLATHRAGSPGKSGPVTGRATIPG
jgi:monoamine oxidase